MTSSDSDFLRGIAHVFVLIERRVLTDDTSVFVSAVRRAAAPLGGFQGESTPETDLRGFERNWCVVVYLNWCAEQRRAAWHQGMSKLSQSTLHST